MEEDGAREAVASGDQDGAPTAREGADAVVTSLLYFLALRDTRVRLINNTSTAGHVDPCGTKNRSRPFSARCRIPARAALAGRLALSEPEGPTTCWALRRCHLT